jgi:hypothetical protein
VKSRKHRGFSAKLLGSAGFDRIDLGRLDLDPLDLDPTAANLRELNNVADGSGALDPDLTAQDARVRLAGGERRRTAVSGGGRRRTAAARPKLGFQGTILARG